MGFAFWAIFSAVTVIFFAMAKINARPGFNALFLGLLLAATPLFSPYLPGNGDARDALTVLLQLVAASIGTALGGGLKPRIDDHHDDDAFHQQENH